MWAYPGERQDILDKLDMDSSELQKGFESGDPSQVRHIYYDKQYISRWTGENWMCKNYCPYKGPCDQEYEKINLGSGIIQTIGVTTTTSGIVAFHS